MRFTILFVCCGLGCFRTPPLSPAISTCATDEDCVHLDNNCAVGRCDGSSGLCYDVAVNTGGVCDDGYFCTAIDRCNDAGLCVGRGDPCAQQCRVCDEAAKNCSLSDTGAPCDDGVSCTLSDQCNDAGDCLGTPNNDACPTIGDVCAVECFPGSTGCGTPPSSLTVQCSSGLPGECTVDLGGLTGQAACLSCETHYGLVPVSMDHFVNELGDCDLGGWEFLTGATCSDTAPACIPTGAPIQCCDQLDSICRPAPLPGLDSVLEDNCGGGFKQWRIQQTFDLTGVLNPRLCFEVGEAYATVDEVAGVVVQDEAFQEVLDCVGGDIGWRGGNQTRCTDLPPWAENNSALEVVVLVHINSLSPNTPTEKRRMSIGNLNIFGSDDTCPSIQTVASFSHNFDACFMGTRYPDGTDGWLLSGDAPTCGAGCGEVGLSVVDGEEAVLERRIDTTGMAAEVMLCLDVGHESSTDTADHISLELDVGDGTGWRMAGYGSGYPEPDNSCQTVCYNLSGMDPRAAHNPNLGIRLTLTSAGAGRRVFIDNVVLTGTQSCADDSVADTSPALELGAGTYGVNVGISQPVVAQTSCQWQAGGAVLSGSTFHAVE